MQVGLGNGALKEKKNAGVPGKMSWVQGVLEKARKIKENNNDNPLFPHKIKKEKSGFTVVENKKPPKWKEKGTDKPNQTALDDLREGTDQEKKGNSFLNFFSNCNRTQKRKITFLSKKTGKKV